MTAASQSIAAIISLYLLFMLTIGFIAIKEPKSCLTMFLAAGDWTNG